MASTAAQHFETVIIGGGQAGLAVGYHLATQQRSFVILDAGERIGDSWRNRWDSLRVFTPARYGGHPGWSFPAPGWSYPTKDEVADYLESYAARFRLPVRTGVRVDGLAREDRVYVVTPEGGLLILGRVARPLDQTRDQAVASGRRDFSTSSRLQAPGPAKTR